MKTDFEVSQIAEWSRSWATKAGLSLWFEPETDSTNRVAKNELSAPAGSPIAPILFLTSHQTAGRGRGSNSWISTSGALLSSWSFHMAKPPQPILAPLVGLAAYRSAQKIWPQLPWSVKAPNDLYLGSKKVGGILIETVEDLNQRRSIIGFGLNVLAAPKEIENSTCLFNELNDQSLLNEKNWGQFLQDFLLQLINATRLGQLSELSRQDAEALKEAMNRRPGTGILKVGPKGELHTSSGIIAWSDL